MKYFLIIFISFFSAMPAYAARQVSGEVPKVEPLQPPPVNVVPNVSNNIQSPNVQFINNTSTKNSDVSGSEGFSSNFSGSVASHAPSSKAKGPSPLILVVILLVGLASFGVFWLYKKKE